MKSSTSKNMKTIAILVFLAIQIRAQSTYVDVYKDSCPLGNALLPNLDPLVVAEKRKSLMGASFQIKSAMDIANGNGINAFIKDVGAYFILLVILAILSIFTILVFLCFCCCCDRVTETNNTCTKVCSAIGFILLFVLVALFIAFIAYISYTTSQSNNVACAVTRVVYDVVYGVNTFNSTFIGFNNLNYVFGNLSNQITQVNSLGPNFNNFVMANLTANTASSVGSLQNFFQAFLGRTIPDGNGQMSIPISVQQLPVNNIVANEFAIYNDVAIKITQAAQTGVFLSQNPLTVESLKLVSSNLAGEIGKVTSSADSTLGPIFNAIAMFVVRAPIGYWIAFGAGVFICTLGGIMLTALCCMAYKTKDSCRCCMKIMLFVISFLTLILVLIAIGLLAVSVVMTTACKTIPEISNANTSNIVSLFTGYGVKEATTDLRFRAILENCIAVDGSGSLLKVINQENDQSRTVLDFLNGLVAYNAVSRNLTQELLISPAITASVEVWNNYQVFKLIDQPVALSALRNLNQAVSCNSKNFQMALAQCGTDGQCRGILESTTSDLPTCASSSAQVFNNLKAFVTAEVLLMQELTSKLSDETPGTPNTYQKDYRAKMRSLLNDFDVIRTRIGGFLSSTHVRQGGLEQNANCNILKLEIQNLENEICFKINNPVYYLSAFLSLIGFFMFFLMWCVCCGMRWQKKENDVLVSTKPFHNGVDEKQKIDLGVSKNEIEILH